jgi:hypothetical protein
MTTRTDEAKQDRAVEDSFPASDPPATSGITGPRIARPPHERGGQTRKSRKDTRPEGTPTDDRHAAETANQRENQERPETH